jgi:hypothetical protein
MEWKSAEFVVAEKYKKSSMSGFCVQCGTTTEWCANYGERGIIVLCSIDCQKGVHARICDEIRSAKNSGADSWEEYVKTNKELADEKKRLKVEEENALESWEKEAAQESLFPSGKPLTET